jgi:hypothetical protein
VSFEKPFFSAIFQTHKNQQMPSFWHFLTNKGPNIVSQYDLWKITIFTSLGLALKMVIFRIFLSEVLGPSVARKKIPGQNMIKKINFGPFWIQQVQIVIVMPCIFSENYEKYGRQFLVQRRSFYVFLLFFNIFQKLGFLFFQFSQWN